MVRTCRSLFDCDFFGLSCWHCYCQHANAMSLNALLQQVQQVHPRNGLMLNMLAMHNCQTLSLCKILVYLACIAAVNSPDHHCESRSRPAQIPTLLCTLLCQHTLLHNCDIILLVPEKLVHPGKNCVHACRSFLLLR